MRFELPFLKKSQPATPERRMPSRAPVTPDGLGGEGIPIDASSESVQFKGYTTIDGAVIDGRTEVEQFNAARGFNRIDGSVGQAAVPKTPEREAVPEVQGNSEAELVRQQALEIQEGLQGEELLTVLEQKTQEFTAYFDQKWTGKVFEDNPEKDADLECLAKLQGRTASVRMKLESNGAMRMRLEKIERVENEQIEKDLQAEQGKLLEELKRTPVAEVETRRDITARILRIGTALRSSDKQQRQDLWDKGSEGFLADISGNDSDQSKV